MDDRERLGWLVRKTWVKWASEQAAPKDSWLIPWEELDEGQREVDMRIGAAVAEDRAAEIGRQLAHLRTLGHEHSRHALAVSAHKARADQQESRAIHAEKQLARFLSCAEEYDKLAEQAAESRWNADLVAELRKRIAVLERSADRAVAAERERIRRGVLARELILQHPEDGDRVAVLTLDLEQIIGAEDGS